MADLDLQTDYYVQGDLDQLRSFLDEHGVKPDVVTSNDILEHIYDVEDFCTKLGLISHEGTVMMHATGANMLYYPTVRRMPPRHWAFEARYFKDRERIIWEHTPRLRDDEVEALAIRTRGLRKDDIVKAVDRYGESGRLPMPIQHPTNTCDPETGWWQEHLMNPYYVAELLQHSGFEADVVPGYWDTRDSAVPVKRILNRMIVRFLPTALGVEFVLLPCHLW